MVGPGTIGEGTDPPCEGATLRGGKGWPIIKYRYFVPRAVQKRLNRSGWNLGYRLRWAQVTIF